MLKEQGLTEVTENIEEIMKNFEFMHQKEVIEKPPNQGKIY